MSVPEGKAPVFIGWGGTVNTPRSLPLVGCNHYFIALRLCFITCPLPTLGRCPPVMWGFGQYRRVAARLRGGFEDGVWRHGKAMLLHCCWTEAYYASCAYSTKPNEGMQCVRGPSGCRREISRRYQRGFY